MIDSSFSSRAGPATDAESRAGTLFLLILALAFFVRFLIRISLGEPYFWSHGYSLFYDMAQNIAAGRGLYYEWLGTKWAQRPPVYPIFLAVSILVGKPYVTIVILQSLVGAGTVACTFLIGRELFDRRVGLLAAAGVAVYPYFAMHDTALQETGLFTFFTAVAVLLLLRSRRDYSIWGCVAAGTALALAVLTRATIVVFVPCALLWVLLFAGRTRREALKKFGAVTLGCLLLIAPWLLRNYFVVGTPTFSTLSGLTLWAGNNPYTFSGYPTQSIDRSVDVAMDKLGKEERDQIQQLSTDEVAQNSWFIRKAIEYIKTHPSETLQRIPKKVGAAFSWRQNPESGRFAKVVYFLSYFPILILGIAGLFISRKEWKEHVLLYTLFLSFIMVTAIFFAHTSHRSYLDVYLIIFSAKAVSSFYKLLRERIPGIERVAAGTA